jgi:hypothetical protein
MRRDGHTMTCYLLLHDDGYLLRLSWDGILFLENRCASPHDAMTASVDAMGTLAAFGWDHHGRAPTRH